MRTYYIAVGILSFLIFGCSIAPIQSTHRLPGEARLFTKDIRYELFNHEQFGEKPPEIGVSLSGGGVRSASFCIGALEGLNQSNILPYVDIISTVSGGGYAGYFYFSSLFYQDKMQDQSNYRINQIFDDCYPPFPSYLGMKRKSDKYGRSNCGSYSKRSDNKYRFQYHIAQDSDILFQCENSLLQKAEFGTKIIAHIPSIPIHHVANSVFDWGFNGSTLRKFYQNGLERTYGLVPNVKGEDEKFSYVNGKNILWMDNYKTNELTFQALKDHTLQNWRDCKEYSILDDCLSCVRIPMWIINCTAGVATSTYEWAEGKPPLTNSVFEISPFGYGSNEYGYTKTPMTQLSIPKAVSISGAAADAQQKSSTGIMTPLLAGFLHLANGNLGYSIDNYNEERANIAFHKFLPWPFYYLHGFSRNKDSVDIYLSDGGHSENLGAYSLIIRGTKNVIIIDAEHDPSGKFEALRILKDALWKEHRLTLSIDKLDLLSDKFNPFNAEQSIFTGKVTGFSNGYISKQPSKNHINIFYVKSSIILAQMDYTNCDNSEDCYPCTVAAFYKNNKKGQKNSFPHHSTAKTAMEAPQSIYYAYRDLAKYITSQIVITDGKLQIKPTNSKDNKANSAAKSRAAD